ncbi:hypothetical protein LJC46_09530 [Desulfovibrio sp. OttesenSCG-928-G15]|nr:hypothetical protein [Desulfovibrio sp. OttesenSCG-928-G15]
MSTPENAPAKTRKVGTSGKPEKRDSSGKTGNTKKNGSPKKSARTGKAGSPVNADSPDKTGNSSLKDAKLASPEELESFLTRLAESGNVSLAADEASLDRVSLFALREEDPCFAGQWEKAREIGFDAMEDEARSRALTGWEEEVWYKGEQCGTSRKYSATLLGLILKKDKTGEQAGARPSPAPMNPADVMAELLRMQEEGG